jgi:hypothetical protein
MLLAVRVRVYRACREEAAAQAEESMQAWVVEWEVSQMAEQEVELAVQGSEADKSFVRSQVGDPE